MSENSTTPGCFCERDKITPETIIHYFCIIDAPQVSGRLQDFIEGCKSINFNGIHKHKAVDDNSCAKGI